MRPDIDRAHRARITFYPATMARYFLRAASRPLMRAINALARQLLIKRNDPMLLEGMRWHLKGAGPVGAS